MNLQPPSLGAVMNADKIALCRVRIGDELTTNN